MKKHEWRENMSDGDVRYVAAIRQSGRWRFQSRLKSEDDWTLLDSLNLEDLQQLREILWAKSQRRRVPIEQVFEIDALTKQADRQP